MRRALTALRFPVNGFAETVNGYVKVVTDQVLHPHRPALTPPSCVDGLSHNLRDTDADHDPLPLGGTLPDHHPIIPVNGYDGLVRLPDTGRYR